MDCSPKALIDLATCTDPCVPTGLVRAAQIASACAWANAGGAPPCPLPTAPVDLGATFGYNQVTLTWPAGVGATGYNIKRSLVTGGPYTVIGTSAASPYVDLTAANFTTYYYVVSSTNACGESATNSVESNATPGYLTDRWYFSNAIPAPGTSFSIGFNGAGTRIVDWGDGTIETTSGTLVDTHVYAAAGNYTLSVRESVGITAQIYFGTLPGSNLLTGILTAAAGMPNIINLNYGFYGCTGLTGSIPDLSALTQLAYMVSTFYGCTGLTGNIPVLSALTGLNNLNFTFYDCSGLTNTRTVAQIFGGANYPNLMTANSCFWLGNAANSYLQGNAADFISLTKNAGFVVGPGAGDGSYEMFTNQTTLTDYATISADWK